jgi:two-component system sensor kinase FixL
MHASLLRRWAFALAVLVVLAVLLVAYHTFVRAQELHQEVVHAQEVLAASESVLATAVDAETGARGYLLTGDRQDLEPFENAEQSVRGDLDRLMTLTTDNIDQHDRVQQLRQDVSASLSSLRVLVGAKQAGRDLGPAAHDAHKARMDAVRQTLRAIQREETRLLDERVTADAAAVRSVRWVSLAMVLAAAGLLGWVYRLIARDVRREQEAADLLRRANEQLEARVADRTADLRDSNARLRSVIDSAVDGIIVIDSDGRIEAFNPGAERLFGWTARDVQGQNVNVLMPAPYREEHDAHLARYLRTGERRMIGIGREVTGHRRDGTTFPMHLSVGEMRIGGERKFTGIVQDLSERAELETRLREQSTLAKLGEMAAVLAHEVKNPLTAIRGAIQVIGGRLPALSKDAPVVQEILARVDALNDLMKDVLLFARPPQARLHAIEIVPLLRLTADLLAQDPAYQDLTVELSGTAPPIMADTQLLKSVFFNLLLNSAQAVQGRGTIRVSIDAVEESCQIAIADRGPGIPADVLEKIFEPFFTTKAHGTGLGLPTVKRLVDAHHGRVSVDCPPGGGTTVTVTLPLR